MKSKKKQNAGCDRCGVNDRLKSSKFCGSCQQGHTPTPYQVIKRGDEYAITNYDGLLITRIYTGGASSIEREFANVSFIVRACNSHDALIEACETGLEGMKFLKKMLGSRVPLQWDAIDIVEKALNQAKKGE